MTVPRYCRYRAASHQHQGPHETGAPAGHHIGSVVKPEIDAAAPHHESGEERHRNRYAFVRRLVAKRASRAPRVDT